VKYDTGEFFENLSRRLYFNLYLNGHLMWRVSTLISDVTG